MMTKARKFEGVGAVLVVVGIVGYIAGSGDWAHAATGIGLVTFIVGRFLD